MKQDELRPPPGSRHSRKRVGRGYGSGHGETAGRGTKGQKARSGGQINPRFEGGQLPLVKRLPHKRGFTNIFKVNYAIVNVGRLGIFEKDPMVTPERLVRARLVESLKRPIKILGNGELHQALVVKANRFSAAARKKIEAAGGKVEEIGNASGTKSR